MSGALSDASNASPAKRGLVGSASVMPELPSAPCVGAASRATGPTDAVATAPTPE